MEWDALNLETWKDRRFSLKDHADSSYFGMGPWVLAEDETGKSTHGGSSAVKLVCAPNGFSYSPFIFVWRSDAEKFLVVLP